MSFTRRPGSGRPRQTSRREDRHIKPESAVSDVIVNWKRRDSETVEKRTCRPKLRLGERSRRTLKKVVKQKITSPRSWKFLRSSKVHQELVLAAGLSVESQKTWDFMVVQPLASQTSLHRMRSIDCNGVELTIIGLWTCGKLFFGGMNLALQSASRMDTSGLGGCPTNVSLVTALGPLLSWVGEA
ncbi:hypothetical protein TNCV_4202721 [Trichonephila clavipes]|uniref:Uncharacterized protein n=1 Tax=Trichonephila clavipes TaxID=2585209 RepID=A0A8X6S5R9_TRICX|nr:hypothetical protein TNCV_4202721 [Trichonephila clavipes]